MFNVNCNEIKDRGGTRSGIDRRIEQCPFEMPERRTIKDRRDSCDRRTRLNYENARDVERRSALRDIDQQV
jgi:hypothetical protein